MSPMADRNMIKSFATQAEEIGVDSLWLGEHVVLFDEMEFPYPGAPDGKIPTPPGGGLLDTVATFGFLASITERLRFGSPPFRRPAEKTTPISQPGRRPFAWSVENSGLEVGRERAAR